MRLFLFIGVPLLAPFMRQILRKEGSNDIRKFYFVFALESEGYPYIGDIPSTLSLTTDPLSRLLVLCSYLLSVRM